MEINTQFGKEPKINSSWDKLNKKLLNLFNGPSEYRIVGYKRTYYQSLRLSDGSWKWIATLLKNEKFKCDIGSGLTISELLKSKELDFSDKYGDIEVDGI